MVKYILLFNIILSVNLIAQNDSLVLLLDRKISNRDFNFSPELLKKVELEEQVLKKIIKFGENIFQLPHPVRSDYYETLTSMYEIIQDEKSRKQILGNLLYSCNDQSEWLRAQNMRYLSARAKSADFNKEHLKILHEMLTDSVYHRTPLFPIIGRLDWKEGYLLMEKLFKEGPEILSLDAHRPDGFIASPKWKAAIALSIKGNEEATQYLVSKTREQTNPRVLREAFIQLKLVKTKPILDFLIEFLFSDRKYSLGAGHLEESDFSMAYSTLYDLIEGIWETHGDIMATRLWAKQNYATYKIIEE